MPIESRLLKSDFLFEADFEGIAFILDMSTNQGGKKYAVHDFVNTGLRVVEPLGPKPEIYDLSCIITGRDADNYKTNLEAFKQVFRDSIEGILTHPFDGKIKCVPTEYNVIQSDAHLGEAIIQATFYESDNDLIIEDKDGDTAEQVANKAEELKKKLTNFSEGLIVRTTAMVQRIVGKLLAFADKVKSLLGTVTMAIDSVASIGNLVDAFKQIVLTALPDMGILTPLMGTIFDKVVEAVTEPKDRIKSMTDFFDFGNDEVSFRPSSPVSPLNPQGILSAEEEEIAQNDILLNTVVQTLAVSSLYETSAEMINAGTGDKTEAETPKPERKRVIPPLMGDIDQEAIINNTQEMDEINLTLENQYKQIMAGITTNDEATSVTNSSAQTRTTPFLLDSESILAFNEMRNTYRRFIDRSKITLASVIEITVPRMPMQKISYLLYGNTNRTLQLMELNDIQAPCFVEGKIKVLTR